MADARAADALRDAWRAHEAALSARLGVETARRVRRVLWRALADARRLHDRPDPPAAPPPDIDALLAARLDARDAAIEGLIARLDARPGPPDAAAPRARPRPRRGGGA